MLFGMLAPTEGQIFVDGKEVHFTSSGDAIAAYLGMVHQHFMQGPVYDCGRESDPGS